MLKEIYLIAAGSVQVVSMYFNHLRLTMPDFIRSKSLWLLIFLTLRTCAMLCSVSGFNDSDTTLVHTERRAVQDYCYITHIITFLFQRVRK